MLYFYILHYILHKEQVIYCIFNILYTQLRKFWLLKYRTKIELSLPVSIYSSFFSSVWRTCTYSWVRPSVDKLDSQIFNQNVMTNAPHMDNSIVKNKTYYFFYFSWVDLLIHEWHIFHGNLIRTLRVTLPMDGLLHVYNIDILLGFVMKNIESHPYHI